MRTAARVFVAGVTFLCGPLVVAALAAELLTLSRFEHSLALFAPFLFVAVVCAAAGRATTVLSGTLLFAISASALGFGYVHGLRHAAVSMEAGHVAGIASVLKVLPFVVGIPVVFTTSFVAVLLCLLTRNSHTNPAAVHKTPYAVAAVG